MIMQTRAQVGAWYFRAHKWKMIGSFDRIINVIIHFKVYRVFVGVVNDVIAGVEVAIVIDPGDDQRWAVFSRRLDDTVVELELTPAGLVDRLTGNVFDPFTGVGEDQSLDKLAAFTSFPEDYFTFFPNGSLWTPG